MFDDGDVNKYRSVALSSWLKSQISGSRQKKSLTVRCLMLQLQRTLRPWFWAHAWAWASAVIRCTQRDLPHERIGANRSGSLGLGSRPSPNGFGRFVGESLRLQRPQQMG